MARKIPDAWYHVMDRAMLVREAFPARQNYLGFIELLMDDGFVKIQISYFDRL